MQIHWEPNNEGPISAEGIVTIALMAPLVPNTGQIIWGRPTLK